MPQTPHVERHFTGSESVRDVVIGMSDGLTVPFALAAGLSGAVGSAQLVVVAGLAEIALGPSPWGWVGFLQPRVTWNTTSKNWRGKVVKSSRYRTRKLRRFPMSSELYGLTGKKSTDHHSPEAKASGVGQLHDALRTWARGAACRPGAQECANNCRRLRHRRPRPAFPLYVVDSMHSAFLLSVTVTLLALFVFGYIKGRFTGTAPMRGAIQTLTIGSLAAGAAYL